MTPDDLKEGLAERWCLQWNSLEQLPDLDAVLVRKHVVTCTTTQRSCKCSRKRVGAKLRKNFVSDFPFTPANGFDAKG